MPKHRDITGIDAVHPFAYMQATDPAEDEDNEVAAGKAWIDTSGGPGGWVLKVRNANNDGWETIVAGGS